MRLILLLFILILVKPLFSQLNKEVELSTFKVYKNLEDALLFPDSVYRLDLSRKKLTEIPAEISQLKNLQELTLKKNNLKNIDFDFCSIPKLQLLNLSKNELSTIPKNINCLKELKTLIANQNTIVSLPKELGELTNLELIDLWSNELNDLPIELNNIKSLKKIDLRVIQFSSNKQKELETKFPNIKLYFSSSCNCD